MQPWIFLSKNGRDQYINMMAQGARTPVTNTDSFDFDAGDQPIVLRGILKDRIMQRCWRQGRQFFYMDSGYFGNTVGPRNPRGWKLWHRIVPNDLQHGSIIPRPADRLKQFGLIIPKRRHGKRIIVAVPDEKPCRFYGIDREQWITDTVSAIRGCTDRPVVIRERVQSRQQRVIVDPLSQVLTNDVHALVTFNSAAAIESILAGVPAFVLAPTHAAAPVANRDLGCIDNPVWPDSELIHTWLCHLSYGQFHVSELKDGTAYNMLAQDL